MNKINFVNNSEPDISAENLNLMQENIDKAKVEKMNITTGTEFKTGRIIDGKEEYCKIINCGNLLNNIQKTIEHGIRDKKKITKIEGIAVSSNTSITLPYIDPVILNRGIGVFADTSNIYIKTGDDKTTYVATINLYYTKLMNF